MNRAHKFGMVSTMLAAVLLMSACGASGPRNLLTGGAISDLATYVYPGGLFTLEMPPTWVVNDTSDFSAVNVEFSPPGSTHAQLTVFITNLGEEAQEDSEPLVDVFVRLFYDDEQAPFKEVAREPQLDGSMRLSGVLQAPGASTQHNDFLQREGLYFVALRTTLPSDPTSLRTLTRIVNSFQLNTDVPWQGAVQGLETTVRRGAVSFSSLNTWSGSNDSFSIAGQVLNNASSSLEFVRVSAKLYDSNNELVDEKGDFIAADVVQPGEFSPFVVLFPDGLPAGTVRYELAATARYADFAAETFYGPSNFDVVDSADFDTNGLLVISGQVTNIGGQRASLVKVIVTVFDTERLVVATDTTLVEAQSLAPGETSTFRVQFADVGGTADTYFSIAQASIIP